MRRALAVGINYYQHINPLFGCVNDAERISGPLSRHSDGSVNFGVRTITAAGPETAIDRAELKDAVRSLFADDGEVALFYFAGHGYVEATGGYLCASDCRSGDDGLSLDEVMTLAAQSRIQNRIIILDSCHSGISGDLARHKNTAELADGMTILTASTSEQYASEVNGSGGSCPH